MTTAATPAQTDHRTKARRFWQLILVVFATATVAANVTYGALGFGDFTSRTVSAAVHALPPVAFLMLVEALLLTAQASIRRWLYVLLLVSTGVSAAASFGISFFSLLTLSQQFAHMPFAALDYVFPTVFDVVMTAATVAVFALGEKPIKTAPKPQNAPKPQRKRKGLVPVLRDSLFADPEKTAQVPQPTAGGAVAGYLPQTHPVAQVSAATPAPKPQRKRNGVPAHIGVVAQRLHAQRIARKLDADGIARILAADADGEPPTRIATDQEVHRDTVYRIIEAAEGGHKLHATN